MEKKLDEDKVFQGLKVLFLNVLFNNYALERVVFGFEKSGDRVPVDLYLKDLHLGNVHIPQEYRDFRGVYIDEQERITVDMDYSEFVRDLFIDLMELLFNDAPRDSRLENIGEELPLLPRLRNYILGLLPLFTEIINIGVKYDVFDIIPTDRAVRSTEYPKWKRFVTAILLKPLKSGSQINRYVKDFCVVPHYVGRLIEKRGKNFYLKPIDVDSYEYIFALFSLMPFMDDENGKLFELKMLEWERRRTAAGG